VTSADLVDLQHRLSASGEPYVVATVVWRRSPSSGQVGSRAVVTSDGRIRGWIAGACAEPTVVAESLKTLRQGSPRLLFMAPPEELPEHQREGVVSVPIQCQSEGALEVYVEPVFPKPLVVAVGRSPAADAVARLAVALGWRSVLVDEDASPADHPGVETVLTKLDLQAAGVDQSTSVVVATQGHYDEEALEHALRSPAGYVGLVASRRRAETILEYLRDRGVADHQLQRVRAPAGLDLGSVPTEEIAVAVMAELVQLKAKGELGSAVPATEAASADVHEAVDPVCGMTVKVAGARHVATYDGRTFYFCSAGCKATFEADSTAYLG
jgi:xanthine dehydrogenase accessory factor